MSVVSLPKRPETRRDTSRFLASRLFKLVSSAWFGDPHLPAQLRLEQRFIFVRYLSLLVVVLLLPLMNLSPTQIVAGYVFLLSFAGYNLGVQLLLRVRSPWLNHGYVTTIGDGLSTIAMVMIGSGFNSPFYYVLYPTTIAAAMRYGYRPSLLIVSFYVFLDACSTALSPTASASSGGDLLFRSSFLVITTLLAGYLQAQARAAEAALAKQLERARALNESTRALSASLDLDTIARTVAIEARQLVNAEDAALLLGPEFGTVLAYDCAATGRDSETRHRQLDTLVSEAQRAVLSAPRQGETPDGRCYMVVPLRSRSGVAGHIAVVRGDDGNAYDPADDELLSSFIDRATLAIENASLYKALGDRSQDLQRAYADLAAAHQDLLSVDEMKTNFITNVSHELRTPLTSIRGFSEILLTMEVDTATTQEFMGIINTESERLTRLINDVLDITKIESGQIDWQTERINLATLMRSSVRTFSSLAEEKGLQMELSLPQAPMMVDANCDRILQVLANLIGNAMKFTLRGVIALSAEIKDGMALVHVRDTGVGIAPDDHERIFQKFHQVGDTLTEKPQGTGLGLCICRDIIGHHGGTVWVESELGQGSTFSFSLPLSPEPSAA